MIKPNIIISHYHHRRRPAYGRKEVLLQNVLLAGISLLTDGRRLINTTAGIQLRKPHICLPATGKETQEIPLGLQQYSTRICGHTCEG